MIIGICGKAGSGKDTVADILVRSASFVRIGLADPLKRICRDVFGFSNEQLWGPSEMRNAPDLRYLRREAGCLGDRIVGFDEGGFPVKVPSPEKDIYLTPRYALQRLGTEWGRDCSADIWAKMALADAQEVLFHDYGYSEKVGAFALEFGYKDPPTGVVIPDVRFRNELKAIRAAGGMIVRIDRPGAGLSGAASEHRSETEMDGFKETDFDTVLVNNGPLDRLPERVEYVLDVLKDRVRRGEK